MEPQHIEPFLPGAADGVAPSATRSIGTQEDIDRICEIRRKCRRHG